MLSLINGGDSMKYIGIILTILLFLLPINTHAEIIARNPEMAKEMHIIRHDNKKLGSAGHFYIPSVDIEVPIYSELNEEVVDAKNSAVYCESFNEKCRCGFIVDHASQGFNKIKQCKLGCYAYIKTKEEIKVFECIEIAYGKNLNDDLLSIGNQYLTDINWADICCYTCNDLEGINIIMIFFKEIK